MSNKKKVIPVVNASCTSRLCFVYKLVAKYQIQMMFSKRFKKNSSQQEQTCHKPNRGISISTEKPACNHCKNVALDMGIMHKTIFHLLLLQRGSPLLESEIVYTPKNTKKNTTIHFKTTRKRSFQAAMHACLACFRRHPDAPFAQFCAGQCAMVSGRVQMGVWSENSRFSNCFTGLKLFFIVFLLQFLDVFKRF